jgi:hypothetical protein
MLLRIEIQEEDFYLLLHAAVSYCMGRKSCTVKNACEIVKKYAYLLEKRHQQVLRNNIEGELKWFKDKKASCGDVHDHERWEQLLEFLKEKRGE